MSTDAVKIHELNTASTVRSATPSSFVALTALLHNDLNHAQTDATITRSIWHCDDE